MNEVQHDLFDDAGNATVGPVIRQPSAGEQNRNEVYRETLPTHSGKRAEVLRYVSKMADIGATRDEIAAALGIPLSSVCGRVNELLNCQPPAVYETNDRRVTRSGKSAVVLRAR